MVIDWLIAFSIFAFMGVMDYIWKDKIFKLAGAAGWESLGWGSLIWGITIALLFWFLGLKGFLYIWMLLTEDMFYYICDSIDEWLHTKEWHFNKIYYLPCVLPFGYNEGRTDMPMKSVLFFWAFTVVQGLVLNTVLSF